MASLPEPSSFIGSGPDYNQYIQAGIQAVTQPLAIYNQQRAIADQRIQQQAQLDAINRRNQAEDLLLPGRVAAQGLQNTALGQENQLRAQQLLPIPSLDNPAGGIPPISDGSGASLPSGGIGNVTPGADGSFSGIGTVFAGPHDLAAYNKAKASGATELQALAVGDNGIGAWGANTADPTKKYVALAPDFMAAKGIRPGDPITVNANGKSTIALVGDKLPNHSKNGSGIDLNPGVAADLGIDPNGYKGPVSFTIGGATSQPGIAAPSIGRAIPVSQDGGTLDRAIATAQALPGAVDLNNLAPIGIPPVDPVHPAVGAALSVANQTAGVLPAASAALATKALDAHRSLSAPSGIPSVKYGYNDPNTGIFVPTNNRMDAVSRGATFGSKTVYLPSPAQIAQDKSLISQATKAGLDLSNYDTDANGTLSDDARGSLQSDLAETKSHGGQVLPKAVLTEASRYNIPTQGKNVDEISQAIEDKQVQTGQIPPHLIPIAQQLAKDAESHPALKSYPVIKTAKESFDAGYANQDTGGFGDMALVEGLQRMLNPGATVRTQTMQQMLKGAGMGQYADLGFDIEHFTQGEKFSPEVRARMKKLADDIYQRATANAKPQLDMFAKRATAYGIRNPEAFVDTALVLANPLDAQGAPDNQSTIAPTATKKPSADTLQAAKDTIAKTGNRAAVIAKLTAAGFDTSGL